MKHVRFDQEAARILRELQKHPLQTLRKVKRLRDVIRARALFRGATMGA
jgi:hypothetical protein